MSSERWAASWQSDKMDWETPPDLFERLNKEFNFTLDACATKHNHKVDKYFTIEDDALSQKWGG